MSGAMGLTTMTVTGAGAGAGGFELKGETKFRVKILHWVQYCCGHTVTSNNILVQR